MASKPGIHDSMRAVLFVLAMSYIARNPLEEYFFPHGYPVPMPMEERPTYKADKHNDILMSEHGKLTKIVERLEDGQEPLLNGPETVIVDNDGKMYAFVRGAKLVRIDDLQKLPDDPHTMTARVTVAVDLGNGAPLGGKFTNDGNTLYVADTILGLFRVTNFHDPSNINIELVASKVMDDGIMTRILYADDVSIGPRTGKVYFSDATDIPPDRILKEKDWDVMYASKVDCVRGKRAGRLLEYNPETGEVKVLAKGLSFANGVAVDKDENFVLINETFNMQTMKYYLSGPKAGTNEPVLVSSDLPGYLDGVDCSWATTGPTAGKCYVTIPTELLPIMKVVYRLPHPFDRAVRFLLMTLPKWAAPHPVDYGGVMEVNMESGEKRLLQDPKGRDMKFLTQATVYDNKLYLGCLFCNTVGIYDLN